MLRSTVGNVLGHDVARADARERVAHGDLRVTFARGAQQEPADEGSPDAVDQAAVKRPPHSDKDHHIGKEAAGVGRDFCGAVEIAGDSPGDTAQDASTVERKSGNEIEDREHHVDFPEPGAGGDDQLIAAEIVGDQPEASARGTGWIAARQWRY